MKYECGETLGDLKPVYNLFPITSELVLPEIVTQKCAWYLSVELSPDLTPSFQLYTCLQICSKDASFPFPVAFSS